MLMCCWQWVVGQVDTLYVEEDTFRLPPIRFHLQTVSASWMDGNVQFFEGFSQEILYADASSGLPLYSDWHLYSNSSILPTYYQMGVQMGLTDSVRGLRLRLGIQYARRHDSLAYGSDFYTNDTVLGRLGAEYGGFGGISVAGLKQTRKLMGFLRLHGGAELEVGISPRSKIRVSEYAYDLSEQRLLEYNVFDARGKPRMNVFVNAILGLETIVAKRVGIVAEVRSGLGAQIVVRQRAYGMARTTYQLGLQYYLWDYNRKALPQPMHIMDEPPAMPLPEF